MNKKLVLVGAVAVTAITLLSVVARGRIRRAPMDRLVAAVPSNARFVEARLTGGFSWAEYRRTGPAEPTPNPADLKLVGVAGEILARAERDPSPDVRHAAGVARVLTRQTVPAVATLESLANTRNHAGTWSDLSAARYTAAVELKRTSLLPMALAAADAALRIDPTLHEALFNRALVLQKMGLAADARRAWERYLALDSTSEWANEARARLAELPPQTRDAESSIRDGAQR